MVTTLASPPGPWLSRISDGASIVCDSSSHVTRGLGLPKSNRHQAQLRNRVVKMTRGVQFDSISLIDRFSQSLGKEIETKFFANVRWNVWKSLEIWFIPLLKFIFSEIIILRRYSISESFAFSNFNRYDRWIVYFDQKGVSFLPFANKRYVMFFIYPGKMFTERKSVLRNGQIILSTIEIILSIIFLRVPQNSRKK